MSVHDRPGPLRAHRPRRAHSPPRPDEIKVFLSTTRFVTLSIPGKPVLYYEKISQKWLPTRDLATRYVSRASAGATVGALKRASPGLADFIAQDFLSIPETC